MTLYLTEEFINRLCTATFGDEFQKNFSILYNSELEFVINSNLLQNISQQTHPSQIFKNYIVHLGNKNRLQSTSKLAIESNAEDSSEFLKKIASSRIIPLSVSPIKNSIAIPGENYICLSSDDFINKIFIELIQNRTSTLSYLDIPSKSNVKEIIHSVLTSFYQENISVIEREMTWDFWCSKLKAKEVTFYHRICLPKNAEDRKLFNDIKSKRSYICNFRYIHQKKNIHERVAFNEFIFINSDNSFNNLLPTERNWTITISLSKNRCAKWIKEKGNTVFQKH